MDLKQLAYFVRVAELGSFTRAASALRVAQPALSRQVRLLEVELHHSLLARNGRGAVPTEAGAVLLEHARGILHQVERTREEMARLRGALAGRVALGLPPSVARALAVPLTHALRAALPHARLSITEGLSASMQEQLASGRLDMALLYDAHPVPGLEIAPLAREALQLVQRADAAMPDEPVAPAAPARLAELAALPLVIPTRPNAIRRHVERVLADAGLRPDVALEIDGVAAILDLVADGAGCAVLPTHAVMSARRPEAFRLRRIELRPGLALSIELFSAVSAVRPTTRTQQAVLEQVRTLVQERLPPA